MVLSGVAANRGRPATTVASSPFAFRANGLFVWDDMPRWRFRVSATHCVMIPRFQFWRPSFGVSCFGQRLVLEAANLCCFRSFRLMEWKMKQYSAMTFDELLSLKEKLDATISSRVKQERKRLTDSLRRLEKMTSHSDRDSGKTRSRKSKPRTIAAKYRNPANPRETWAGRGLKPRWLMAALKGGKKKLSDFAINGRSS